MERGKQGGGKSQRARICDQISLEPLSGFLAWKLKKERELAVEKQATKNCICHLYLNLNQVPGLNLGMCDGTVSR